MKRVLIDSDDFVWHVLTESEACYYFDCGFQIHVVTDDGDTQLKSKKQIGHHMRMLDVVATPVGFMDDKLNV